MKKLLSLVMVLALLCTGCFAETADPSSPSFKGMNDPALLQFTEDQIYAGLVSAFGNEDYIIENVKAIYISQEYLDELAFNSQSNIFFGYTLDEIGDEFKETGFIFTLGDNMKTVVEPFEEYRDNAFDRIIRNVAIGTGVILICVTVSVCTAGAGFVTTSIIFAEAARTAATCAVKAAAFSGLFAGIVQGYQTGDLNEAVKAAVLTGSESFKWGAITGSITGGLETLRLIHAINKAEKAAQTAQALNAIEGATEYAKGSVEIPVDAAGWRQAELRALNEYGGYEQLSFLDGERVAYGTQYSTRPDIIRYLGDHIEAIEVKYYDLENNLIELYDVLEQEVSARVVNLPFGSTQRIILDVTDRGYSTGLVEDVANSIWDLLDDIYPNIPIDVVGLMPI